MTVVAMDVAVDGRLRRVTLDRADDAGPFRATLDGRTWTLDAHWVDSSTLSLLIRDEPAGEQTAFAVREIGLVRGSRDELALSIGGRTFSAVTGARAVDAEAADGRREARDRAAAAGGALLRAVVRAPMPGRVARVLVAAGDRVTARQNVVAAEAMKMENELAPWTAWCRRSPRELARQSSLERRSSSSNSE